MFLHPEIHHNMYNMIQITTAVAPLLPNFSGDKNKYFSNAQQTYYKNNFLHKLQSHLYYLHSEITGTVTYGNCSTILSALIKTHTVKYSSVE